MMNSESARSIVLETLAQACSQSADVLKPAQQQLQQWETVSGFYQVLTDIFCDHSIAVNIRWLAALYCKNGVDRYWRKNAPNAVNHEEKEFIKKRLMSDFQEPVPQIATQIAVLVAKIARFDCPRNWQELIPTLIQAVRCEDLLVQGRALLVLYHVTKTLASKRLANDRKLFEDMTQDLFSYVTNLWNTYLENFFNLASQHDENMSAAIDRCKLVLKVLRKQVSYGFKEVCKSEDAMGFVANLFIQLDAFLDCRRSLWGNHIMLEKCEDVISCMTKVLLDLLEMHPKSYVAFIKTTLNFVLQYNFTAKALYDLFVLMCFLINQLRSVVTKVNSAEMIIIDLLFERFTVNCFNLMKGILFSDVYKPSRKEEDNSAITLQAYAIVKEFFTLEVLAGICQRLVLSYFLLTTDDLTTWDSDPEEFCQEEGGDSYKYSLRPCTQTLFLTTFKAFRQHLTPVILQMAQAAQGPCDPDDFAAVMRKDAVYNAVGLASYDLFDEIDFDSWFTSHLIQELHVKHKSYRVIRKRVIWLVGQWVGVKFSSNLRPTLYETILALLDPQEDLAVRLEAAQTLRIAVDDFEFTPDQLLPYVENLFSLLFLLLKAVKECDTKMHVLHVFSFLIERMGPQIKPYISSLVQYLPLLWQESEEHNMLRCAILTSLVQLVQGYGSESSQLWPFLIPAIAISTDTNQDPYVYLVEDGLELWHITLINASSISPELLKLFEHMPALLEISTENLKVCLKIIQCYVLLGTRDFMQAYSEVLASSLISLMSDIRSEGMVCILKLVELVVMVFPNEGPSVFQAVIPRIIKTILDGEEDTIVMSMYLTLFARIMVQNNDFMMQALHHVACDLGHDINSVLGGILDVWFDVLESITQQDRKKMSGLAFATLLPQNLSVITERFGSLVNGLVEILHDVCREDENGVITDGLIMDDTEGGDEEDTPHDKRKRLLAKQDPVHNVCLKKYAASQMNACQQIHGKVAFDNLMTQVDEEVKSQMYIFSQ